MMFPFGTPPFFSLSLPNLQMGALEGLLFNLITSLKRKQVSLGISPNILVPLDRSWWHEPLTLARTSAQTGTVAMAQVTLVGTWAAGGSFPSGARTDLSSRCGSPEYQPSDHGQVVLPPWPQFLHCVKWKRL